MTNLEKGLESIDKDGFVTNLRELQPLAEQGDAEAQNNLGLLYSEGLGVTKNYKEAVNWFKLSAEQGLSSGQFNLGSMYEHGNGVPQDYILAHMWFNLATSQGDGVDAEGRDDIAKIMTREQIAEAQKLARDWMAKNINH